MGEIKLTGYPSIDRPWLKYYEQCFDERIYSAKPPCISMYEWLISCCKDNASKTALQYCGTRISYRQMIKNINRTAAAFQNMGVCEHDIVAVCMPNTPEGIYTLYALNALGAVSCLIDPRTAAVGIKNFVNEVCAQVIVIIDRCVEKLSPIVSGTTLKHIIIVPACQSAPFYKRFFSQPAKIDTGMKGYAIRWPAFMASGKGKPQLYRAKYTPNTVAVIGHTGGTTGIPKGVELTNEAYNMLSFQQHYTSFIRDGDISLGIMPLFSAYGSAFGVHIPLCAGKKIILIPEFRPEEFVDLILRYRPNHAVGVPAFWELLATSSKSQHADLSFLNSAVVGGDRLNPETELLVNRFFEAHACTARLTKGYGLTETCSCCIYTLENACNAISSVGIPLFNNNCKIVLPGTNTEIGYDKVGEICLSGPTLMRGYYNNAKATQAVIKRHDDGEIWLHTGDLGRIGKDGLLYFVDRIKRIIIGPNGHNVFPLLSENLIAKHPEVEACAVVGRSSSTIKNGVIPTAFVVLRSTEIDLAKMKTTLDAACKDSLPECDCPYEYQFIASLPLTAIGKVDYRALEKLEIAEI